MGYEVDSIREYTCPCGKGLYRVTYRSNDWMQTDESWEMLCPSCRKNYILDPITRYDSGISYRSFTWITKEEFKKRKNKEKLKHKAITLAKRRHLKPWLQSFEGLSKKKVWEKLPKNPWGYPSLGTFYSHVKHHGSVEDYLGWRFEADIEDIIPAHIKDDEIEDMLKASK